MVFLYGAVWRKGRGLGRLGVDFGFDVFCFECFLGFWVFLGFIFLLVE